MSDTTTQPVVHVHFDGRSDDIPLDILFPSMPIELTQGIENTSRGVVASSSNMSRVLKEALANHYDRAISEFSDFTTEFHENGNFTIRPKAEFGV
jgi:hypothetical protein